MSELITVSQATTASMHILQVVRQYRPMIGGLEEAVRNLSVELARSNGFSVSVLTLDRSFRNPVARLADAEVIDGIPVRRIPYIGSSRYPVAPAVLRHVQDADLVHVHGIDFFFDFLALTKVFHRKPLVASTHGGFFHTAFAGNLKRLFFRHVTRRSARAYSAICASSESDGTLFAAIAPDKVEIIENGVAVDKWRDAASIDLRKSIIAIGRFSENKRLAALIETVDALNRLDSAWQLTIVGQESDLSADDLRQFIRRTKRGGTIRVHTNVSDAGIADLIAGTSYIASASQFEGFGLAAVEGMSAGLVPLLSPIPPFRKLISESGAGAIIDFEKPEQAAQRILAVHAELARNHHVPRRACVEFAGRYGWGTVAAKMATVYRRAIAERSGQTSILVSG